MVTWVLIVVASLGNENPGAGVYSVPGFKSEQSCNAAKESTAQSARLIFGKNAPATLAVDCKPQ